MQGVSLHPQLPGSIEVKERGAQTVHPLSGMEVLKLHLSLLLMSLKPLPACPSSHLHVATFVYKIASKLV